MTSCFPSALAALLLVTTVAPVAGARDAGLPLASGNLRLAYGQNFATESSFKRIETSFAATPWDPVGVQLDLGIGKRGSNTSTAPSAAIHVFQDYGTAAFGGYIAAEDMRPGNSYYYGIEYVTAPGPLAVDVYAAWREDISAPTSGLRYGLDAAWRVEDRGDGRGWSVLAGGHGEDAAAGHKGLGYLGAAWHLRHGVTFDGRLGVTEHGHATAVAGVTFGFGEGARFHRRDSYSAFPAY